MGNERRPLDRWVWNAGTDARLWAPTVMVRDPFAENPPQMFLADGNQPVQTLPAHRRSVVRITRWLVASAPGLEHVPFRGRRRRMYLSTVRGDGATSNLRRNSFAFRSSPQSCLTQPCARSARCTSLGTGGRPGAAEGARASASHDDAIRSACPAG